MNQIPSDKSYAICTNHIIQGTSNGVLHQQESAAIIIDGNQIRDVIPQNQLKKQYPHLATVDAGNYLVTPGFINAHTHVAMGFFRDLGHGHSNMIETFLFPAEKALNQSLTEDLTYGYATAGVKSGTTCFNEHYYFVHGIANTLERLGCRAIVSETLADQGGAFPSEQMLDQWLAKVDSWPYKDLIQPALGPHACDTVSYQFMRRIAHEQQQRNMLVHMHMSQTQGERQRVLKQYGCSPVALAQRCGLLNDRTIAVHLVSADDQDIALLQNQGTHAVLCPRSQIVYEKLAPYQTFLKAGLSVSLGTDCAASNDTADMLEEARFLYFLAKHEGCPDLSSASHIAKLLWENPAHALGMQDTLGFIGPGYKADLVFWDHSLTSAPMQNAMHNLLFSKSSADVEHVMIDGKFVVWQGQLTQVNEQDALIRYEAACRKLKPA